MFLRGKTTRVLSSSVIVSSYTIDILIPANRLGLEILFSFSRRTMDTIETISEELMEFRELIETLSPLENYLSPSAQYDNINGKTGSYGTRGDPVLLA